LPAGRSLLLPQVSPPLEENERESRPVRRLPVTPVYEGGGPFATKMVIPQGPKLLRDKLYDRMVDWDYHSVAELDNWMLEREWVKAMLELIHYGFTFDRKDKSFRLRKRLAGEPRPSIVDLLSGATLPSTVGEKVDKVNLEAAASSDLEKNNFIPVGDPGKDVPEDERMELDEEKTMVLSALDYATDTCAILARKGRGKTYLAMLLAESLLKRGVPFVVVDPTGCWSGLLSKADGSPAEHVVVLMGGENGHYPLSSDDGRATARLVVAARPLAFVLDLSAMSSEEQHLFVADFADELYRKNRSAIHVFIDEADIFAPQKRDGSSKHQKRCLVAVDNMTRRGRFRGIGDTLISQRPAVVNKDVLSQVGSVFFLQMIAPQDLNAVDSWLHDNIPVEVKESCRTNLPVIGLGVSYYLRGGDDCVFRRFKVRKRETYDSSYTPRMGEERQRPVLAALSSEDKIFLDRCREVDKKTILADFIPEVAEVHEEARVAEVQDCKEVDASEKTDDDVLEPEEDACVLGFEDETDGK